MAKAKKTKKVAKKASAPAGRKKTMKAKKPMVAKKTKKSAQKKGKTAAPKRAMPAKAATPVKTAAFSTLVSPLDDRILVRLTPKETKTAGGLFIPDTSGETSGNSKGDVVAVGRGHRDNKGRLRPLELKVGDRVVFAAFSGAKVTLQGEELVILRESEVLGILET